MKKKYEDHLVIRIPASIAAQITSTPHASVVLKIPASYVTVYAKKEPGIANTLRRLEGLPILRILEATSASFRVPIPVIIGKSREQRFMDARHVAMYLAQKCTGMSLNGIAEFFSRDHSTLIYAGKSISKRIRTEPELAEKVQTLLGQLGDKK